MKSSYQDPMTNNLSKKIKTTTDFDFLFERKDQFYLVTIIGAVTLYYLFAFQKGQPPVYVYSS